MRTHTSTARALPQICVGWSALYFWIAQALVTNLHTQTHTHIYTCVIHWGDVRWNARETGVGGRKGGREGRVV